ncbi:hypothetical protein [Sphingomonas rubra]|nr:hypothetical protein [Sphingomonas rubra]
MGSLPVLMQMADGTFGYRRGIAPMLWVLVALCVVELVVVHLLLAIWVPRAALLVSILTLVGMGWLIRMILSFDGRPVRIEGDCLVLQVGTLRRVTVPLAAVAGVRLRGWSGEEVKRRSTLNLALVAWPNVAVDLAAPLPGRRGIVTIVHRLDDPHGFAAALRRLGHGA